MKIDRIILYNFNSYEGLNEFDFTSQDSEKNIILIGGRNGAGKTSLFTAIKIALYGPLAFGYVSANPHYISKIKECINSKAYKNNVVKSKVQITISLMVEREIKEYEITREWDYTRKKLEEKYYVKMGGELLDEQRLSYFQNFLQGLVPPDLFEFFLFDGEAVGNIFSTSLYNSYVRNAIYTLCRLDIFEIIRKFTDSYVGKATGEDEEELYRQYDTLCEQADALDAMKIEMEEQIATDQEMLEQIETELIEVETAFKNAGGITKTERQKLKKEFEEAEHIKSESLTRIKLFVEDLMPFFIVKDFIANIVAQIDFEEKSKIYYYVQQKLTKKEIKAVLNEKTDANDEAVEALMQFLLKKFEPRGFKKDVQPMHDLSKEDVRRVNLMISELDGFNKQAMIELINQRRAAADKTVEINKILKSAISDEEAERFIGHENALLKKKDELTIKVYENQIQVNKIAEELVEVIQQRDKAFQSLKDNAQNQHVLELSSGLNQIMRVMLSNKTVSIRKKLEKLIVEKLKRIYQKNNLIVHIEIEEDFQINLYQNAKYNTTELAYLIRNLGKDAFSAEIGKQGQSRLFELYKVDSVNQLQHSLLNIGNDSDSAVDLYKRIDLGRLSKGERQIFILALYWAIIELSGQDIPFVIDTPYARVDANHRREISEKFFPNISKQVIILSTDEEINEEYYEIIKPYIAKEFLLVNEESQNRTSVEQHYFFKV